jgi:hypothetical protein
MDYGLGDKGKRSDGEIQDYCGLWGKSGSRVYWVLGSAGACLQRFASAILGVRH